MKFFAVLVLVVAVLAGGRAQAFVSTRAECVAACSMAFSDVPGYGSYFDGFCGDWGYRPMRRFNRCKRCIIRQCKIEGYARTCPQPDVTTDSVVIGSWCAPRW